MIHSSDRSRTSDPLPEWQSGWASILPSAFVITALVALLIVPWTAQSRLDTLRAEIDEVAEPARDLVAEVQYALARQSSSLRGYLITSDSAFLSRYDEFTEMEQEVYPRLEALAGELGPEIVSLVTEMRELTDAWRNQVVVTELAQTAEEPDIEAFNEVQDVFSRSLDAASRTDAALRREMLGRAQEINTVERLTRAIYSLLVVIALGAALAVALLNARIRRLAAQSNERRAEAERAIETTEKAVAARSYLIRGFTHDVKNPLGAADGYAGLLEIGVRGELTTEQAETVHRIRRSIRSAIEIIDELLDLSRLESGGLKTVREATNVDSLVGESVRQHAAAAAAAGIDLTFEPSSSSADPVAYTDPDRVTQIVGNLVSNALKYTPPEGRVRVGVRFAEAGDIQRPGRWVVISVVDTGPGIPPHEIERIFDEFHRVPGAPGKGHGLGLAISRGVAHLLGGDVTVKSTPGEGSEFMLWLPLRGDSALTTERADATEF